jgi:hypothetical protein
MDQLERNKTDIEALKEQTLLHTDPYMGQTDVLIGMKGVSVFIVIAIIANIIDMSRFKNSKHFTAFRSPRGELEYERQRPGDKQARAEVRFAPVDPFAEPCDERQRKTVGMVQYDRLVKYKKAGLVRTGLRWRVLAEMYRCSRRGSTIMTWMRVTVKRRRPSAGNFLKKTERIQQK